MSTASVGGVGQGLYQFLHNLSASSQSAASAASSCASVTSDTPAAGTQQAQSTGHHHHGHGGLFKKIEAAVTSALQSAQSNSSADPNTVIEQAIAKVFSDNGITPPTGASGQGTPPTTGTDADGDNDGSKAGSADNADQSTRNAFFQMLKGFGVDPQQFRQDLLTAIKDAQNGNTDTSTALRSLPPGAAVDTSA